MTCSPRKLVSFLHNLRYCLPFFLFKIKIINCEYIVLVAKMEKPVCIPKVASVAQLSRKKDSGELFLSS